MRRRQVPGPNVQFLPTEAIGLRVDLEVERIPDSSLAVFEGERALAGCPVAEAANLNVALGLLPQVALPEGI